MAKLSAGRDDGAVGEHQILGHGAYLTRWRDQCQARGLGRRAAFPVEAEVAHVGASLGVDHHVVAVAGGDRREVRVRVQRLSVEAQELAVAHRDHQHVSIGQEAEAGRLRGHLDDGLARTVVLERDHAVGVHVGEQQSSLMEARPFRKVQSVHQQLRFTSRHEQDDTFARPTRQVSMRFRRLFGLRQRGRRRCGRCAARAPSPWGRESRR
jgi:hypothetical protein